MGGISLKLIDVGYVWADNIMANTVACLSIKL
jgi:hypothetical protein